jgi:hypothetical protein
MTLKTNLKAIEWLEKENLKDKIELESQKKAIIANIKKLKKEDILPPKPKKISLWKRILKALMG